MLEEDLLVGISIKMDVVKIMVVDWITFSIMGSEQMFRLAKASSETIRHYLALSRNYQTLADIIQTLLDVTRHY